MSFHMSKVGSCFMAIGINCIMNVVLGICNGLSAIYLTVSVAVRVIYCSVLVIDNRF